MKAFISYRRGVSSGWTGRFAEKLKVELGAKNVFIDIETLQPGVDFVQAISGAVASCDVLMAIIAPDWIGARNEAGERRLDDPADFVRIEISSALERGVRVIPVLVGGAIMPKVDDLPSELQSLARRQAHELSDSRWDFDCQRLIEALRASVTDPGAAGAPDKQSVDPTGIANTAKARYRPIVISGGGIGLLIVAAYLGWLVYRPSPTRPPHGIAQGSPGAEGSAGQVGEKRTAPPSESPIVDRKGNSASAERVQPAGREIGEQRAGEEKAPGTEPTDTRASVVANASSRFNSPTVEGYRVDVCLTFGKDCGQPAADEWCCQDRCQSKRKNGWPSGSYLRV